MQENREKYLMIIWKCRRSLINPLVPNAAFLYPLKASENRKVFCFQGVEKGCIGKKWVKGSQFGIGQQTNKKMVKRQFKWLFMLLQRAKLFNSQILLYGFRMLLKL